MHSRGSIARLVALLLVAVFPLGCQMDQGPAVAGRRAAEVFGEGSTLKLVSAACRGDSTGVQDAMREGAGLNRLGSDGSTPLVWAVLCHNSAGVEALLAAGSDPNIGNERVPSATYLASGGDHPEILKLLLMHGGDPNAADPKTGDSALYQALAVGFHTREWTNWNYLLEAGADINKADEVGNTIAIQAVNFGEFKIVSDLLDRGYNYNIEFLRRAVDLRTIGNLHDGADWKDVVQEKLAARAKDGN